MNRKKSHIRHRQWQGWPGWHGDTVNCIRIEALNNGSGGWCSGDHYNESSNRGGEKSRKMAEHGSFDSEQFERPDERR